MLDEQTKQRMKELCDLIVNEQDHRRFSSLVAELNRLLDDCYSPAATDSKKEDRPTSNRSVRSAVGRERLRPARLRTLLTHG